MKRAGDKDEIPGQGSKRKAYEKALRKLQVQLCHLQEWVKAAGRQSDHCI